MLYQIYERIADSWTLIRRVEGDETALLMALQAASTGPWSRLFTTFRAAGRRIVGATESGDRLVKFRWDRRGFTGNDGQVTSRPLPWGDKGHITTEWADVGIHGPVQVVPRSSMRDKK